MYVHAFKSVNISNAESTMLGKEFLVTVYSPKQQHWILDIQCICGVSYL